MEWDRRAFVKLAVGAALGFGVSPLQPKLMDDVAIWTQNWSWVPDPEAGALAFASTTNPATGTGVKVRMINGRMTGERLIRVEGNPDHPVSRGGVIPEDASALQLLYNDSMRVTAPTVRDPKTSAPHQVSWEEALGMVAKRVADLFVAGQGKKVCLVADDPDSTTSQLLMMFSAALGTPNLVFTPSPKYNLALAGAAMMGQPDIGFDLENADYVVSFGTPLFENFGAPVATRKALASWRSKSKKGATFVQVEPRASVTAGKADNWLPCRPGTEGAVALGICNLLMENGGMDQAAVGDSFGFLDVDGQPGFKTLLKREYTPANVARISGVCTKKLEEVAKGFAAAKRPLAVCGPDNSGGPGRFYDFMAVLALNALKGRIGKPGGVVLRTPAPFKTIGGPLQAPKAPRLDGADKHPLAIGGLAQLAEASLKGDPYRPEVVILVGCNPVFSGPQAGLMEEFLDSVPMVVSITPYMDETAVLADVTLPACAFLEGWGDNSTPYASPKTSYGIHRPLIKVQKNALSTGDIILALAKELGGPVAKALPFASMKDALKARTAGMGKFDKLSEAGFWAQKKINYGSMRYQTHTGKFEFTSMGLHAALTMGLKGPSELAKRLKEMGVDAGMEYAFMPHYEPPEVLSQVSKKYPLLMTGIPSLRTTSGNRPTSPYMIKVLYDTTLAQRDKLVVEINPRTAAEHHLKEGDMIEIKSEAGAIPAMVHLFAGAAPGTICVPQGLGHTCLGGYLDGIGQNYQEVVMLGKDAISGQPQWDLTPVMVKKAGGVSHV